MKLKPEQVKLIDQAIHYNGQAVWLDGHRYPVEISPLSKCRYIQINKYKFIEQNKATNTEYARRAIGDPDKGVPGQKITWVIHKTIRGPWGRIVDGVIEHPIMEEP